MDPTLTRSQAHRYFGELYQKQRSPEAQKLVDDVVKNVSDIFVRIKRIEEIDGNEGGGSRGVETRGDPSRRKGGGPGGKKSSGKKAPARKAAPASKPGFLTSLFGGDLAKWGERTGTLDSGFLALNLKLSKSVPRVFEQFDEDSIVSAIRSFRFAVVNAWEHFPPEKYNVLVCAYQFFQELIKVPVLFKKQDSPATIIQETLKAQVLYAQLLKMTGWEKVLLDEFPSWVGSMEDISKLANPTEKVMRQIVALEKTRPKLSDCFLSLYALERKKIVGWPELLDELKVKEPVMDEYRAPDSVMQRIHKRIAKLKEEIRTRKESIQEIQEVRKNYFQTDSNGRVTVDFLDRILSFVIRKTQPDKGMNEDYIKAQKSEPHRLLHLLLADYEMTVLSLLTGTVQVDHEAGGVGDGILFKSGLFKLEADESLGVHREMEEFLRKYKNTTFTFQAYVAGLKAGSKDAMIAGFAHVVARANKLFRRTVASLRLVLHNHEQAVEKESHNKASENLLRTKTYPIEILEPSIRFIPMHDRVLAGSTRLNGKRIDEAIETIVMNLYNFLYIFRDDELVRTLASIPRLKSEIQGIEKRLVKYGVEVPE
ncbi:MAG: hypothetical protein CMF59_01210 [Leptospiraceae bacterium]|nr:hypothetical protein [Leptospiraceae bacterium]